MSDSLDHLTTALASRYAIEREIGRGGMAIVYLAHDLKHQRKVAVKVLRRELAATLGAQRFLREIEIAANLTHPHILPLYDSGEADGFLYYVMPYIEGETLSDRINREGQLPLDDALQITKDVAAALSYAHSQGLIHRDIKPENVLLSAGEAVVADFGIARAVSAAGGERLTQTGLAVGTPAYASPEQASGDRDVDARSDLYSLGCVLYEMLAGDAPYNASTPLAIIAKKLADPMPRVSVVRESVPPAVETALEKALARMPADRFATAQQFAEALTRPSVEFEPAVPTKGTPPSRRRSWILFGGLAGVAIAAIVLLTTLIGPDGPPAANADLGGGSEDVVATQLYRQALARWTEVFGVLPTGANVGNAATDLADAGSMLEQALDRDPDYAQAVALLSLVTGVMGWLTPSTTENYESARILAGRALLLDSSLAESQFAGAMAAWATALDWNVALRRFRAAMEVKPRFPGLAWNYSYLLGDLGLRDEAISAEQHLAKMSERAWIRLKLGDLDVAREYAEQGLEGNPLACKVLFCTSVLVGDTTLAREVIERCGPLQIAPLPPDTIQPAAYLHALAGRREDALRILTTGHRENHELMAIIYAALGNLELSLEHLEQAFDKDFVYELSSNPLYAPLHNHPRFHALLARMQLVCTYEGLRHHCEPIG